MTLINKKKVDASIDSIKITIFRSISDYQCNSEKKKNKQLRKTPRVNL